jgi:hypothetical protein
VPLMTVVVTGVEPHEAGLASALLNVGQQVGGSIGLSVLATVAATSGKNAATDQISKLGKLGNPEAIQHFGELSQQQRGNFVASAAAQADGAAQHALSVVGAHAAGMGFLAAAIFGVVALLAATGMIKTGKHDISTVDAALPVH